MPEEKDIKNPECLIDEYILKDYQFRDNFQTREQKARDCEITKLLREYVVSYDEKIETQKKYRKYLLIMCSCIITVFSLVFFDFVDIFLL